MVAILIWWVVDARKWFKGPKVNVAHQMHHGDGMLEGKDPSEEGISPVPSVGREEGDKKAGDVA